MSNKTLIILIIILCLVIGAGVGAYFYLSQVKYKEVSQTTKPTPKKEEGKIEEQPEQMPEETKEEKKQEEELLPLPKYIEEGEAPFRVSSKGKVYPKFKSGKWSKRPDFIIGGKDKELEAEIKVQDPEGVSKVSLLVIGHKDNLRKEINLKLSDGDSKLGTWSAKFEIPEEIKRIFWTNFYAKNNKGKEDILNLDWRPGNTCPISPTGNLTFGSCTVSSDETAGTENGQVTVTGTVNLSGTASHPAYLIFGTKVTFGGGKVILYGSTKSIIIKKGRTDSVHGKAASLCAYPSNCHVCGSGLACINGNCQSDPYHLWLNNANKSCNTACSESGGRTCGHVGINATKDDMKYYREPCCNNPTGSCATSPGSQDCLTRAADCSTVIRRGVETWGSEFCCYGHIGQMTICYCYCP